MRFLKRIFGNVEDRQGGNGACFPLFMFDCREFSDKGIMVYGDFVKKEIKKRIRVFISSVATVSGRPRKKNARRQNHARSGGSAP